MTHLEYICLEVHMLVTVTAGTTLAVGSTAWCPGRGLLSFHTVYVQLPKHNILLTHQAEKKWIFRVVLNLPSVVYIVPDYTVTDADPWTLARHLREH